MSATFPACAISGRSDTQVMPFGFEPDKRRWMRRECAAELE